MSKCRETFNLSGFANTDPRFLKVWQAAWNARGKVDYQQADANYADEFVLKAIEQENEK